MLEQIIEVVQENFMISTDKSKLDLSVIYVFLTKSYWATNIPIHIVKKSIENSLCFGVYDRGKQVGFARVISDYATFAYIADVFILPENRGNGLSKFLMQTIKTHPELQNLRRWMLATRDAHTLYEKFGFVRLIDPDPIMVISNPNIYQSHQE
ncbi:MAG: GNAT family N-acetyltransferase [Blastocatellia bacterium]|nr:GNAT family N-acetyltransferase [Blastocatellia bacterium]MBN8723732.1 GNAT family N-acetyltransferase [Acidobacteriota bacterium]